MLSKIPQEYLKMLSVRDLETLLDRKRRDDQLRILMAERDKLVKQLEEINLKISEIEEKKQETWEGQSRKNPIIVHKRKTLKDYIVDILQNSQGGLTASEIQKKLIDKGVLGSGRNPRSFYNTVFQALQRYPFFVKKGKLYSLNESGAEEKTGNSNASLKDFIVAVLDHANGPLKASEIASRVLIAGYKTELSQDGLTQRVSVLLKKHLNHIFDWDSQRYRLINRMKVSEQS